MDDRRPYMKKGTAHNSPQVDEELLQLLLNGPNMSVSDLRRIRRVQVKMRTWRSGHKPL